MLARLLQEVVLGALSMACGWLWLFWSSPVWISWAFFLRFPVVHGAFIAIELAASSRINRRDPSARASGIRLTHAWHQENWASLKVFAWWQPFRSRAAPDLWVPARPGQRGVVFIHGFVCNRGVWNSWLKALRSEGRVCVAINLEPVFGSIDLYAGQIDEAVTRVIGATGLPPVLVCHSMGGLAARAWLRAAGPGSDRRFCHIITLGTPHHGTWLGRFSPAVNGLQMHRLGPWARQLVADEPPGRAALFTCWYSNCGNIVFPASTATLSGADNRLAAGVGHVQLALDPGVMRASLEIIGRFEFIGSSG